MWTPTKEEVLEIIAFNGDRATVKRVAHYTVLIPILFEVASNWCNTTFDMSEEGDQRTQSAVKSFIAKAAQYHERTAGLIGRRMGSVSYTFTQDMPSGIYKTLKPYKKLRW